MSKDPFSMNNQRDSTIEHPEAHHFDHATDSLNEREKKLAANHLHLFNITLSNYSIDQHLSFFLEPNSFF